MLMIRGSDSEGNQLDSTNKGGYPTTPQSSLASYSSIPDVLIGRFTDIVVLYATPLLLLGAQELAGGGSSFRSLLSSCFGLNVAYHSSRRGGCFYH